MGMGFKNPVHLQAVFLHMGQHPVGRSGAGVAGLGIAVNHRCVSAGLVPDHTGDGSKNA